MTMSSKKKKDETKGFAKCANTSLAIRSVLGLLNKTGIAGIPFQVAHSRLSTNASL